MLHIFDLSTNISTLIQTHKRYENKTNYHVKATFNTNTGWNTVLRSVQACLCHNDLLSMVAMLIFWYVGNVQD